MDLPSKLLEQIVFNTRSKIEEHMIIVMDKSIHEENSSQPLQTNIKKLKIAVTLLSVYNGIFNVTTSENNLFFKKSLIDEDFIQIRIPIGAYEIESLNDEIKRTFIDEEDFAESDYPFHIKLKHSNLGSIVEIKPQGPLIGFVFNDNNGNLLGFDETILYEEYNLSKKPVDVLSFDNIFMHTDIAQEMIFKAKGLV